MCSYFLIIHRPRPDKKSVSPTSPVNVEIVTEDTDSATRPLEKEKEQKEPKVRNEKFFSDVHCFC